MALKYPAIDILKLYTGQDERFSDDTLPNREVGVFDASKSDRALKSDKKWMLWLAKCRKNHDLEDLIKVRYGLQVGMDDLVKKKLVTNAIVELFLRWQGSIERTARQIIKDKIHFRAKHDKDVANKALMYKREMENDFERFLKRSSY